MSKWAIMTQVSKNRAKTMDILYWSIFSPVANFPHQSLFSDPIIQAIFDNLQSSFQGVANISLTH